MMSNIYPTFFYFISVFFFFNMSNPLTMWLTMEINLLCFLFLMSKYSLSHFKYKLNLYYFLVQSLGSLLFLYSISFNFSSYFLSDFFFVISIVLKLGLFPMYFWMLNLGGSLSPMIFFLILTFQKIGMMVFLFNSNCYYMEISLFLSFFFGSIMLFFCKNFNHILVVSSLSSSLWVYFFYLNNFSFYLLYFFFYFLILYSSCPKGSYLYLDPSLMLYLFMFLSGVPPALLFFFKFGVFLGLSGSFGWEHSLFFFFFTFLGLFGYMNFFQTNFFSRISLYLTCEVWFKKMSKMAYSSLFLFFFLL